MKKQTVKIIISPAKKMKVRPDILPSAGEPEFLDRTAWLLDYMRKFTLSQLQEIWKCNDSIALENYERIQKMELNRNLTPAILSYEGIQYKYMGPAVFDEKAYEYLEKHLYILSGFYGVLRPFDGVTPYRLEMQARFHEKELDSLYDFWGTKIADIVLKDCGGLVNLASKEYSKCVMKYLPKDMPRVTCVFGEVSGDKVKEKGTYAKMARGEMVRYMAEEQVETLEDMKSFDRCGYCFVEEWSDEQKYVFLKK